MAEEKQIKASELISRFVFDKKRINSDRVHFRVFFDPNSDGLSVSRTSDLSADDVWALGDVAGGARGPAIGCGDMRAEEIRSLDLEILPDEPPPRHALVTGWPTSDKDRCRSIATQLAAIAVPRLRSVA
jgi:hypothetical protein